MAIQTRGFGVDVMPQFTPVNPSMVATDPNRVTAGVLQSFQLADVLAKMNAYKKLQEEQDATRQGRLASINVGNQVAVGQGQNTLSQLPAENELALSDLSHKISLGEPMFRQKLGAINNAIRERCRSRSVGN